MAAWTSKVQHGRSGLEEKAMGDLARREVPYGYECLKIPYVIPESTHKYTPDFHMTANDLLIETKGIWDVKDRQKIAFILKQHPPLKDVLCMLFNRANDKINKKSKTTYGMVCEKLGIRYASVPTAAQLRKGALLVPQEWLDLPPCPTRRAAIEAVRV